MTLVITHGSFSCQATAARPLSPLGGGISETAQPYQTEAPAALVHPALSRAAQKEMFQAKKHRTCLTHMPSQWVRGCQVIPTVDGHHRRILYLWRSGGGGERRNSHSARGYVRARGQSLVQCVLHQPDIKLCRRPGTTEGPHTRVGWRNVELGILWASPSQLGPLRC